MIGLFHSLMFYGRLVWTVIELTVFRDLDVQKVKRDKELYSLFFVYTTITLLILNVD